MAGFLRRRTSRSLCSLLLKPDPLQQCTSQVAAPCSGKRALCVNTAATCCPIRIQGDWVSTKLTPFEAGMWARSAYSGVHVTEASRKEERAERGKLTLYRAKWIRPIRLLVRLKLFQLGGVMALAIPLAEYSHQGTLAVGTTLAVGAVVSGAAAASAALWYYSRRLIGEMALVLPDLHIVQISVLDFWGNREDLLFDVRDVLPPLKGMTKEELEKAARQIVIPLDVINSRQFFLSLRHGYLIHKDILFSLLNGSIELRDLKNIKSGI